MLITEVINGFDHGNEKNLRIRNIKTVIKYIDEQCSDFVSVIRETHRFLYRGIKKAGDLTIFVGHPMDYRRPIGGYSDIAFSDFSSNLMKLAGFTATRQNSIFCNSKFYDTTYWGRPFVIFPLNGFHYGFSTSYTSTTADQYDYPDLGSGLSFDIKTKDIQSLMNPEYADRFASMNDLKHDEDLAWAMEKEQDVWIRGKYLAISIDKYPYIHLLEQYYGVMI